MPSQGRRNVRAQLLMNYITNAQNSAHNSDYLNAVSEMRAAAQATGLKLPSRPFGMPDVVRGLIWHEHRAYYHQHFERVAEHVNKVLQKYRRNGVGLWKEDEEEDE